MMMGWLLSAGAIARIIGPVVAAYTLQYGGPSIVFIEMVGLCIIPFVIFCAGYKTLAPTVVKQDMQVN